MFACEKYNILLSRLGNCLHLLAETGWNKCFWFVFCLVWFCMRKIIHFSTFSVWYPAITLFKSSVQISRTHQISAELKLYLVHGSVKQNVFCFFNHNSKYMFGSVSYILCSSRVLAAIKSWLGMEPDHISLRPSMTVLTCTNQKRTHQALFRTA